MTRKAIYEIEIMRSDITPRQFFTYCKKEMERRTGHKLTDWCESYEDWSGASAIPESDNTWMHDDWDEPATEVCRTKAFNWQLFLSRSYNFILEFDFQNDNHGYGYMYAVEYER